MQVYDKELVATVFVEALVTTDERACAKYGISLRTLQRWRKKLASDPLVSQYVATKKEAIDAAWADDLGAPIKAAAKLITDAAESADQVTKRNPEFVRAIAGALKICAEVKLTSKIIDARTVRPDRPQESLPGAGASESDAATDYVS
jgi:predicted Zn-dependent protease